MKKQAACMVLAAVFAVQSMSSVSMAASMPENGQEIIQEKGTLKQEIEAYSLDVQERKTGLVMEDGVPHVYDENGTLIRNATPVIDGKKYYVDGDGVAQTGWLRLADWQMYFDPETYTAATGITHIDEKAYLFDENGVEILRSRTEVINGRKYWFQPDGSLMSGWCRLGNWTMYFDPVTYAGARGICEIEGIRYVFDENGVLIKGGTPVIDGKKYYADANGVARCGWLRLADWQMYFDPNTYTAATGITHIDGKAYLFDENGVEILKSRTEVINGKKYWFQPDGSLMSGWCVLGDWRMYFDPDTYEAAIGVRYINGTRYEFDENGVLIEYSSYVGNWIAVQGNTEIRVQISSVLDNRVWGSAEVHSLTSDRVADIDFSGPLDQNGTLTCSYSDDGWGAKGLLKLTLQNRSVHLYTQETGYSSDYTGEWSFGNQNVILVRETEPSYSSYRGTWYCNDGDIPLVLAISDVTGSRISARMMSGDGWTYFVFDQATFSDGIAVASYTDPYGNSGQVRLEFGADSITLHITEWNHVSGDEYGYWVFNGATFTR